MHIHRTQILLPVALLLALLLAACGGSASPAKPSPTPSPSPTQDQGTRLLNKAGQMLNSAKTLHAIFDITLAGSALNGHFRSEVWNMPPDKNRTVILQSNVAQFPAGMITISNGQQEWQYNPATKVVYEGKVNTTGTGTGGTDQNQFVLAIVRGIFTQSSASLVSSSASINGHAAYDVHVTPLSSAGSGTPGAGGTPRFSYDGDIYLDKNTDLPLRVVLAVQGFGQITLDIPMLALNQPLDASLFTFTPPPGAKIEPFPTQGTNTGSLTLAQAEQQAGYHLLSIPTSQSDYQLQTIDALGAPGNQIYTLNYLYKGNIKFSISQGKALAGLPASGHPVNLRGTTGTLSTVGSTTTLSWTEKGVGIQIAGPFSSQRLVAIGDLLM